MDLIRKGRILEKRINAHTARLPQLRLDTYFFCFMWLFFLSGIGLFIYALVFNINIILIGTYTNPIFHTGLGISCALCFIGARWGLKHGG